MGHEFKGEAGHRLQPGFHSAGITSDGGTPCCLEDMAFISVFAWADSSWLHKIQCLGSESSPCGSQVVVMEFFFFLPPHGPEGPVVSTLKSEASCPLWTPSVSPRVARVTPFS